MENRIDLWVGKDSRFHFNLMEFGVNSEILE